MDLFGPHLRDLKHEVFEILLLNGKRRSLGRVRMDDGTVTETNTYAREIMSVALQRRAASIVLVHNHPSGDPAPTEGINDGRHHCGVRMTHLPNATPVLYDCCRETARP